MCEYPAFFFAYSLRKTLRFLCGYFFTTKKTQSFSQSTAKDFAMQKNSPNKVWAI